MKRARKRLGHLAAGGVASAEKQNPFLHGTKCSEFVRSSEARALLTTPRMAEKNLDKFYEFVQELEVAMFTTRRADGLLVSRPMATQARTADADIWFVTAKGSAKLAEIRNDANVNLAYYKDRTRERNTDTGNARIVED